MGVRREERRKNDFRDGGRKMSGGIEGSERTMRSVRSEEGAIRRRTGFVRRGERLGKRRYRELREGAVRNER